LKPIPVSPQKQMGEGTQGFVCGKKADLIGKRCPAQGNYRPKAGENRRVDWKGILKDEVEKHIAPWVENRPGKTHRAHERKNMLRKKEQPVSVWQTKKKKKKPFSRDRDSPGRPAQPEMTDSRVVGACKPYKGAGPS